MSNGRPSERGILEVADDLGNVITDVNRLRLGPGMTMTRNDNDPSIVIDSAGGSTGSSAIIAVDTIADLRALPALALLIVKTAQTRGYATEGDGGGWSYDWYPSNTDTDDGALTIKVTAVTTGRFKFRKPDDCIFPLSACSIDGTGVSHVGVALSSLAARVYAAGYFGLRGSPGRKYNVSGGAYNIMTRPESVPWMNFNIEFCADGASSGISSSVTSYLTIESGVSGTGVDYVLAVIPYGPRTFTQTIYAGGRTFNNVSDIRNLTIGDPLLIRCGADPTDASGPWYTHHIAHIVSITPTTGNAGNIVVDAHVDETPINPLPSDNINFLRTSTQHDLMKVTGFQDNISFENCTFNDVLVDCQFGRNFRVDNPKSDSCGAGFAFSGTVGVKITNPYYKKVIGINLTGGNPETDPGANYGWWLLLNLTRDTEVRNLRIDRLSALGGILNSELKARDTVFSGFTNVKFSVDQGGPYPLCGSFTDFSGMTPINVDHFTSDGGGVVNPPSSNVRFGTLVLGKNSAASGSGDPTIPQYLLTSASAVHGVLIYRGNEYRTRKYCSVMCAGISPSTTRTFPIPFNGIVRNIRVYSSSLTGLTFFGVRGTPYEVGGDQTSSLAVGQWANLTEPTLLSYQSQNMVGDVQYIKITTNGSWSASDYFIVDVEVMQNNGVKEDHDSISDSSALSYRVSSGAPSTSANYIGQENLDLTNGAWYKAISIGSGSADWSRGGVGDMLKADNLSGLASAATARTNLGLGTAATQATGAFDAAGAAAAAQAASQPLDADLTAIAALSTTSFGRSLLALASSTALAGQIDIATLIADLITGGFFGEEVIDYSFPASGTSTYTTPTFNGNAFRSIRIYLILASTTNCDVKLVVNSDTGTNYQDQAWESNGSSISVVANNGGVNGYARIGTLRGAGGAYIKADFAAQVGQFRLGEYTSSGGTDPNWTNNIPAKGWFTWRNSVTNITSLTITPSAGTFQGAILVAGVK